jgi:hypothetical protein
MADATLAIRIQALVDGLNDVAKLAGALGDTSDAAKKTGDSADDASSGLGDLDEASKAAKDTIKDLTDSSDPLNSILASLTSNAKKLALGFIALAGVMTLKEAADTAARTETLGVTLGVVGANAGYSTEQLTKYENQLKSLGITTGAARSSLTQLIQAGINLNQVNAQGVSKAAELARASQDLAVVTGQNSSDTLSALILNIRQLDTEGLRYLGLSVDVNAAQEKFAQTIGKSADSLTQQQKQQAVMNAALQEATALSGSYEAALGTVGKQLSSMSRYQEEAANAVGNLLLPAYGGLVIAATELLKTIASIATKLGETSDFSKTFGAGLTQAAQALSSTLSSLVQLIANLSPAIGLVTVALGEVVKSVGELVTNLIVALDKTSLLATILESIALLVAGLADGFRLIGAVVTLIVAGWEGLFAIIFTGIGQIVSLFDKELGAAIDKIGAKLLDAAGASQTSFNSIMNDFSNGNTAVQRLIDTTDKAKKALADVGKGSSYADVIEDIRKLTEAQNNNTINSVEAVAAGNKIRASIERLGGSADITASQMSVLAAKVGTSLAGVEKQYSATIQALGVSIAKLGDETLFVNLSKNIKDNSGYLIDLATNAKTTGAQFSQAFSQGIGATKTIDELNQVSGALVQANLRLFDTSQSVSAARIQFGELFNSSLEGSKTVADVLVLEESLDQLQKKGVITNTELSAAFVRTAQKISDLNTEFQNSDLSAPLRALNLPLENLQSGLSQAGKEGVQAFADIAAALEKTGGSARLTGEEFLKVFNSSLGQTQTLQDVQSLITELNKAKDAGAVFGQTYKDALSEAQAKFQDLFDTQLKSANTRTEFDALTATVRSMGAAGVISGTQLNIALDQIKEKATGAKASIMTLAQQATELAQAQANAGKANTAVQAASNNLETEQRKLVDLTKKARTDNSKEIQIQLTYQKAVVAEAEAEKNAAQARYRLELTEINALIAKQRELNAEKKVELNPNDEGAQKAADLAKQESDQKELAVEQAKEAVAETDNLVESTKQAVEQAKAYADEMGVAVGDIGKASTAIAQVVVQSTLVGKSIATWDVKSIVEQLQQAGLSLSDANATAKQLLQGQEAVAAFGAEGVAQYDRISKSIDRITKSQQAQQDKAAKISSDYSDIASKADLIATGVLTAAQAQEIFSGKTDAVSLALQQVQIQAAQVAKSANDAATSFLTSANNLQIELLNAQGKQTEATRLQYEARKQDLALEYQLLQLKIQGAIVTAQAAGLPTQALEQSLSTAASAYERSKGYLDQLEAIDVKKAKTSEDAAKKDAAAKKAQLEADKKGVTDLADMQSQAQDSLQNQKEAGSNADEQRQRAQIDRLSERAAFQSQFTTNLVADLPSTTAAQAPVQSIANSTVLIPDRIVQVDFTNGDSKASLKVPENDANNLLDMLSQARKRS